MFDKVRAKFTVTEIARFQSSSTRIRLSAQYDPSIQEDQRYAKATPNGSVEMYVDNPPAAEFFEMGKAFYLDFTKAN